MHARALKSFNSRYGYIRRGTIFQPEPSYAKQLIRNKLIEETTPADARQAPRSPAGPGENREDKSIPGAPERKKQPGKDQPGKASQPGSDTAATPDAGAAPSSPSSPADPASPSKTLTTSAAGGRRAVTTPKRTRPPRKVTNPSKPGA